MKKIIQITIAFCLLAPAIVFGQGVEEPNCFECAGNAARGYKTMASGFGNTVLGDYSAAFGQNNYITGTHAFAFGEDSDALGNHAFALGRNCQASANYAFAFGKNAISSQMYAFSLGKYSESTSAASFAIGTYVNATNQYAFAIGKGNGYSNRLVNDIENSLMIGFSSEAPTFFLEPAPGNNLTGRIGIGPDLSIAGVLVHRAIRRRVPQPPHRRRPRLGRVILFMNRSAESHVGLRSVFADACLLGL